jgi:lysine 2,3-aminomutase
MKFEFYSSRKPETVSIEAWRNWQWQLRKSPKILEELKRFLPLQEAEILGLTKSSEIFSFRVTPYYLSLIDPWDSEDPIRRIALPRLEELSQETQSFFDPLGERKNSPVNRIIHRYSDRVLFLVTDFCSVYCRYCTRKHFTGQEQVFPKQQEYEKALDYIKSHPGICEVILSGGDPLTLSNDQLDRVLSDLRAIEHVEIIRIGSRMPVVCPMRIDSELVEIFKKNKPIYLMTHFNHPRELTKEATDALNLIADSGTPMMNQMVLLNGVNNHPAIVQALCRRLLYLRVKPYYMFQCDPSQGTDYLRTPIEQGEQIMKELWGHLSGLAMPIFSLDIPNGGGKTTLVPNFEMSRQKDRRAFKGWDGVECEYINPSENQAMLPSDFLKYQDEWLMIQQSKKLRIQFE